MARKAAHRSLIGLRRLKALALLPFLLAATKSTLDPAQALSGRYYRQFPNGNIDGDKYTGEDVVEIVSVAPGSAYVRVELDFFNGHECSIYGIARSENDALVYRDPSPTYDGKPCVLTVKRAGRSLLIDDDEGTCHFSHCGARGSFSDVKLPYSSKRPIRYMSLLKASDQYRWALDEWRTGTPIEEQWKNELPPHENNPPDCAGPCPMAAERSAGASR